MDRIREQSIPKGINTKLPGDNRPYNGSGQLEIWIDDFFNAVRAVGGSAIVACLLLQNYLTGLARSWLNTLPDKSIGCWFDMRIAFIAHFRGTYMRPHTASDLQQCVEGKNETSREFLTRWLETRNACEGVADETCMLAFINGLQKGSYMRHKLQCDKNTGILTLNDMIHYVSNCAAADDDAGGTMPAMLPSHKKNNNINSNNNNGKQKNPSVDQQAGGSDNMIA